MTQVITGNTTVRDLIARYAKTRRVFERYGIDFCCGGTVTLTEAAQSRKLELCDLMAALQAVLEAPTTEVVSEDKDWYTGQLHELVQHILRVHHAYLKKALPTIGEVLQIHLENNILFPRAIAAESAPPSALVKLGTAVPT